MKSERCSDEICFADEIKSVPISRRSRISSRSDFIHRRWIYSGQRTDLVEKKHLLSIDKRCFFSGGEQGIRTLETVLAVYTISNRAPSTDSDNSPYIYKALLLKCLAIITN